MSAAITAQSASTPSGAPTCVATDSTGIGDSADEPAAPLVVHDDHATTRLPDGEQPRLVPEVALHVAVEVEVVPLQVGEADDVERQPADPAERERVRGDLHGERRRAPLDRQREDRLQGGRLDRGPRALDGVLADPQLDGAEHGGRRVRGPQRGVEEVGGGGLAVGARDADRDQPLAGCVVRPRGDRSGDRARVLGDQDGDPSGQAGVLQQRGAGLVREDRHGAGVDRLRGVRGAVHLEPRHRDEHVTGDHVAAGQAHAGQHGVGRQRRTPRDQAERRDEVGDHVGRGMQRTHPSGGRHGENLPRRPLPHARCGSPHHVVGKSVPVVPDGATPSSLSVYPATSLNTGAATVPP